MGKTVKTPLLERQDLEYVGHYYYDGEDEDGEVHLCGREAEHILGVSRTASHLMLELEPDPEGEFCLEGLPAGDPIFDEDADEDGYIRIPGGYVVPLGGATAEWLFVHFDIGERFNVQPLVPGAGLPEEV